MKLQITYNELQTLIQKKRQERLFVSKKRKMGIRYR